jgi:hypothetical protein
MLGAHTENPTEHHNLKHFYGKFFDNSAIKQSSKNDLEQEAIIAMKSGLPFRD